MTWLVLHCVGLHYIVLGTLYIARLRMKETGLNFTTETGRALQLDKNNDTLRTRNLKILHW